MTTDYGLPTTDYKKGLCSCSLRGGCASLRTALVLLCICLIFLPNAHAATYYVSPRGGGNHNGSSSQNAMTLTESQSYANSNTNENILFLLDDGDYGDYKDETQASRSNWVTYRAISGNTTVFSYIRTGYWAGPSDKYISFEGVKVLETDFINNYYLVYFLNSNYIEMKDCEVVNRVGYKSGDSGSRGIYFRGSSNIEVSNCYVGPEDHNSAAGGLEGFFQGISGDSSNDVLISNNEVQGCQKSITLGGMRWDVLNNHVHEFDGDGIVIAACTNCLVEGNNIHDSSVVFKSDNSGASYDYETRIITSNVPESFNCDLSRGYNAVSLVENGFYLRKETGDVFWQRIESCDGSSVTIAASDATRDLTIDHPNIEIVQFGTYEHNDGIQANNDNSNNIIIRSNIIRNIYEGQGMFINPIAGDTEYTIENNLVYNLQQGYSLWRPWDVRIGDIRRITIRNNVVEGAISALGSTTEGNSRIVSCRNNVAKTMDLYVSGNGSRVTLEQEAESRNYVVTWNPSTMEGHIPGTGSVTLANEEAFYNLFNGPHNGDWTPKVGSIIIGGADPIDYTPTDILGKPRDSNPDAGCYEYGSSSNIRYGDVSGDGEVSAFDAALTARIAVGLDPLDDKLKVADVSGDGEVSAFDAALIAQRAVGLIDRFPVEG